MLSAGHRATDATVEALRYERLYLPDKGTAGDYPNLAGTFARPIRWDLVEQQYDEMVKSTVAVKRGTVTSEAILNEQLSADDDRFADLCSLGSVTV